jgi:hypothetical protein
VPIKQQAKGEENMLGFLLGLAVNGGIVASMYFGLHGGSDNLYTFGLVACWILVALVAFTFLFSGAEEVKSILDKSAKKKWRTANIVYSMAWDIPICYLLIMGGNPILSSFYMLLHMWYYARTSPLYTKA